MESIDIDNLLLVSKLSLFSRIEEIVKDVIRTRSFRGNATDFKTRFAEASVFISSRNHWHFVNIHIFTNSRQSVIFVPSRLTSVGILFFCAAITAVVCTQQ